jgi:C1A family cysteine protease
MNFLCKLAPINIQIGDFQLAGNCNDDIADKFAAHISEFGLSFETKEEYDFRLDLFTKKEAEINEINEKQSSFQVGHNQFSTMTPKEFSVRLGHNDGFNKPEAETLDFEINENDVPKAVDWRNHSPAVVNPVKNQMHCGSCWAFSATGTVESAHAIATGELLSLSEQQLVSCDTSDNHGCNGGLSAWAFDYLKTHG